MSKPKRKYPHILRAEILWVKGQVSITFCKDKKAATLCQINRIHIRGVIYSRKRDSFLLKGIVLINGAKQSEGFYMIAVNKNKWDEAGLKIVSTNDEDFHLILECPLEASKDFLNCDRRPKTGYENKELLKYVPTK